MFDVSASVWATERAWVSLASLMASVPATSLPLLHGFLIALAATALVFAVLWEKRRWWAALHASEERFLLAERATNDALWDWHFADDSMWWGTGIQTLFGYSAEDVKPSLSWWIERIHPEDRERVIHGIHEVINSGGSFWSAQYRFLRVSGEYAEVLDRGHVAHAPSGRPMRMVGAIQDVTERNRVERSLRQGELRLRLAMDAAYTFAFEWDIPRNEVRRLHSIDNTLLPETPADAPSTFEAVLQVVHPEDREAFLRNVQAAIARTDGFYQNEYRVVYPNGDIRWLSERGRVERDEQRRPILLTGFSQDSTERRRDEEELRASEERFRATFDNAAVGMAHVGLDGQWLRVNAKLCAITGYSHEELLTRTFQAITHPDDLASDLVQLRRILSGQSSTYSIQKRYFRHDGRVVWVNVTVSLVSGAAGEPKYFISIVEDITDRKKAELELRESEEQLGLALEAGQLGFWDWDVASGITHFGGLWAQMLGYSLHELKPEFKTWQDLLHPSDAELAIQRVQYLLQGRSNHYESEHRLRHKNGSWRWILARGRVVRRDSGGAPLRVIGTHTDITALKETAAELIEAVRTRDTFLSVASHELNTPLTPLALRLAQLKQLAAPGGDLARPAILRQVEIAENQVKKLSLLVNELLDVSRISERRLNFHMEEVDVSEVVRETVQAISPQAERVGCPLNVKLLGPLVAKLDRMRLGQVVWNLLSNALKFGAGHPVTLMLERDHDVARLSVKDAGIGIAADHLPRVFNRFERAVSERHYGGLGLGLWVARELVEAMGGRIEARSELGKGSTFTVELPVIPLPRHARESGIISPRMEAEEQQTVESR